MEEIKLDEIKLIDIDKAAAVIDCSKGHVYNLIAAGELRRFDIGIKSPKTGRKRSKTRVAEADVRAYVQAAEVSVPTAGDAA